VLLAPACASFDQFKSFEHRGETFKKLVADLTEKTS
jgi:UDP-N-acetylmuramoylalanine--D-glutamate ligase